MNSSSPSFCMIRRIKKGFTMETKNNNFATIIVGKIIKNAIILIFADALLNEGKLTKGVIEEISAKKN